MKLSRRQFLKNTAGLAIAAGASPALMNLAAHGETSDSTEKTDLAVVKSKSPEAATIAAVEALGGIGNFVKSGDVVVIKPNMAFPNPPNWGSTTNPEVVLSIVKLCIDGGARLVMIIDNPMSRPEQCLQRTGIAAACEKLGTKKARVSMETEQRDYKEINLEKGKALKSTQVHKTLLKADVFINIPVAKSHSATGVSFGLKNIMGLIWDRKYMHDQINLHQGIADLSTFIKPSLILIDATRILTTGGPQGPGRAANPKTVIAGTDPVATDSCAVSLSPWNNRQYSPKDVEHIAAASALGLGEIDVAKLNIKKMEV